MIKEVKRKKHFFGTIRRFLGPAFDNKVMYLKALFGYLWWTLGPILSVLFFQKMTVFIEQGNKGFNRH